MGAAKTNRIERDDAASTEKHPGRFLRPGQDVATALEAENRRLAGRVETLEREAAQLEEFAAMAAHEILQPLVINEACATSIRERAEDGLDAASREELDVIINVSSRVRWVVEAMLVNARNHGRALPRESVDVAAVVRDCVATLEPSITAHNARVRIGPMPVVPANAALLAGVFGNLLTNALKFAPASGIEISITAHRSEARWEFGVESPGPAIPQGDRARIFERWNRGHNGARAKGSGLGLALVRQIVEQHGGEVGVRSPRKSINRFYFTLPA